MVNQEKADQNGRSVDLVSSDEVLTPDRVLFNTSVIDEIQRLIDEKPNAVQLGELKAEIDEFLEFMVDLNRGTDIEDPLERPFLPFVRRSRHMKIAEENEILKKRLEGVYEITPYLQMAKQARDIMVQLVGEVDPDQLGDLVFRYMLEKHARKARGIILENYEREHQASMFERVIQEIEKTEGPELEELIIKKYENNLDLQEELRASARTQLMAKKEQQVKDSLTAGEMEWVEREGERLEALDRLDAMFRRQGQLDIGAENVTAKLELGDTLTLRFALPGGKQPHYTLTLMWAEDQLKQKGWTSTQDGLKKVRSHKYPLGVYGFLSTHKLNNPEKSFVKFVGHGMDRENGTEFPVDDVLIRDRGVMLVWHDKGNQRSSTLGVYEIPQYAPHNTEDYNLMNINGKQYWVRRKVISLELIDIDFETRNI